MTEKTLTLGAQILANQEWARNHPLEVARERARRRGQEEQFDLAKVFFDRFKKHVEDSVAELGYPLPLELTPQEERALEVQSTTGQNGAPLKTGGAYAVWQELEAWAESQDLYLHWKKQHDGGGMKVWWTLGVSPQHQ
jgi:hypothetical protein